MSTVGIVGLGLIGGSLAIAGGPNFSLGGAGAFTRSIVSNTGRLPVPIAASSASCSPGSSIGIGSKPAPP